MLHKIIALKVLLGSLRMNSATIGMKVINDIFYYLHIFFILHNTICKTQRRLRTVICKTVNIYEQ